MNMIRAITSLIEVMNMVFKHDKGKEIHVPKKNTMSNEAKMTQSTKRHNYRREYFKL
jgi:hypothetical protein